MGEGLALALNALACAQQLAVRVDDRELSRQR
jgi:hypothetical protein